jgi:hypothetical protein
LIVFVGVTALAIDIGYISTTRNELQNASDAAALAATGKLGQIYMDNGAYDHDIDYADVRDVAIAVGIKNLAAGLHIAVAEADIEVGKWDFSTHTFDTSETTFPNAVKVITRRDTLTNGPINSLFAGIFGIDSFDVRVDAVAALSGQGDLEPGEAKLPLGVSERWFLDIAPKDGEPDGCRDEIHLSDTGTACAGWHTYEDPSVNVPTLRDQLNGVIIDYNQNQDYQDFPLDEKFGIDVDGWNWLKDYFDPGNGDPALIPYEIRSNEGLIWLLIRNKDSSSALNYFLGNKAPDPFLTPGADFGVTDFEFHGGVSATMFHPDEPLPALFDFFKVRDEEAPQDDDETYEEWREYEDSVWRTTIPVYKDNVGAEEICINPNDNLKIVGAADIIVKSINSSPSNDVTIEIDCTHKNLRGSGGTGSVTGAIPNLVE